LKARAAIAGCGNSIDLEESFYGTVRISLQPGTPTAPDRMTAQHPLARRDGGSVDDSFAGAIRAGPIAVLVSSTLGYWAYAGGQSTTFGVMKSATRDGVGLTELEISGYFSAAQFCAALTLYPMGMAVDTYGIRRPLMMCVLLMTAACFGISMAANGPAVALGLFALRLGNKSSELAFKTQVNYHHVRARGRAMAVTSMFGNQLGSQVAVPLAANLLCAETGFRTTYRIMGVSAIVVGCTALALARERFAGVEPAPEPQSDDRFKAELSVNSSANTTDAWTKGRVMRCPAFWAHVLVVFVAFNMELGWIYDVREVVLDMGVADSVTGVNAALILRAAGGGLGTLLGGILYDCWGARVCMCSAQIVQVAAMCLFGWRSPSSLWAICVLAGMQSGMVQVRANSIPTSLSIEPSTHTLRDHLGTHELLLLLTIVVRRIQPTSCLQITSA
jgi:predicted MFS family arabinose efflux permease